MSDLPDPGTSPTSSSSHSTGESTLDSLVVKQNESDTVSDIPTPLPNESNEQPSRSSAPSPAPTEIIPVDLTPDEIVEHIKTIGIKVRDFGYEHVPIPERAIELFDPIQAWNTYETVLSYPPRYRPCLPGKITRRLLDMGWIKREDEERRWNREDKESLEGYEKKGSHYPWRAYDLVKPKRTVLAQTWRTRYQDLVANEAPGETVAGRQSSSSRFRAVCEYGETSDKKRSATTDEQEVQDGDVLSSPKKRRLENHREQQQQQQQQHHAAAVVAVAAGSSAPLPSQPPVMINGRPPQQYPAGNPAEKMQHPSIQSASSRALLQRIWS